ncbi:MAG TPA: hypothetical protein EYP60_01245 [bacterium (Candidatus Stahlbacteria)]|nr:hypothetical protein [Candidatus Stahlbacteria bacterium]
MRLTNSSATKSNIKSKLQAMQSLSSNDVFFFHFSGHGSKDENRAYLVTYDLMLVLVGV